LADTSVSMSRQDKDLVASGGATAEKGVPSRAELVRTLLEKSPLLETLRKTHDVSITTFDSQLVRQQVLRKTAPLNPSAAGTDDPNGTNPDAPKTPVAQATPPKPIDWGELLRPRGVETRLGEALQTLVREEGDETLSGIVFLTDGQNNAGVDPIAAAEAAVTNKVRLIPVGVGSTKKPVTLQLAEIQAPTHVHINDGFTITAFISGQGLAKQPIVVELMSKLEQDEGEPAVVQLRDEQLLEDGVPITVPFDFTPTEAGRRVFRIRVRPARKVAELAEEFV